MFGEGGWGLDGAMGDGRWKGGGEVGEDKERAEVGGGVCPALPLRGSHSNQHNPAIPCQRRLTSRLSTA